MTIDWLSFSPFSALFGGILIGIAAAVLMAVNGHIAGISGILGGVLQRDGRGWRIAFITGLVVAPVLWAGFDVLPLVSIEANTFQLIAAGLLVGFGTRLGSGCTSGHGVCGLARFSLRSLVATLTFMTTAMIVVFVTHHLF